VVTAHIFDVAPTLLAFARAPVLATMEGRALVPPAPPPTVLDDWEALAPRPTGRGNPRPSSPELEERLKSLGYVGAGEDSRPKQ
jgi:hypothetical protein